MPTLGPFFKWLRPNHWKHVVINPKSLGNSHYDRDAEALERVWPHQPNQMTSDDTLLGRSAPTQEAKSGGRFPSYEVQEQQRGTGELTPREMDQAWMKGKRGGMGIGKVAGLKDGIELKEREVKRGA